MAISIYIESRDFDKIAGVFKALADPTRLRVLDVLTAGERCVCQIQGRFVGMPQNLLSHHLRVLREAGLVIAERRGRWVHYRLNEEMLTTLRSLIPELQPQPTSACYCQSNSASNALGGRLD